MAAILVSTLPTFASLPEVVAAAGRAFAAEAVASGAPFLGATPFGVVAVDEAGQATLAETAKGTVISW